MHLPWSKRAIELGTLPNFKGLCLGNVNNLFKENLQERIIKLNSDQRFCDNYYRYSSRRYCRECEYMVNCAVCPVYSLIYNNDPLLVPDHICKLKETTIDIRRGFK